MTTSQLTAANLSINAADGVRYAYRRFGNATTDAVPLLFLQHFRGNLDNWDPHLVDAIADQREVILVDYAGVGGSNGHPRTDVTASAQDILAFTDALGLRRIDLLGFSLGGFVAQEVTLIRPQLARRLILAGTGPQGCEDMHGFTPQVSAAATVDEPGGDDLVTLFFPPTETSTAKGWEFIQRIFTRQEDRDEPTDLRTRDAELDAITKWGVPDPTRLSRLAAIKQPVLVANGDNDIMIPTKNTELLGKYLPNATMKIYPDSGHGFLFQYPVEFAAEVNTFLQ
ncbi:MAG: alpha/beta hydrolase fold protein [Amycolatopsis sp.]|jgi:pimeloyl-ACP methyl ester carboxylesterase|uniref:alpha/beta fold hydrolase n=1 Tax=Amycolatopsis sp. TaxID=37632 RepID=UPI002636E690|nr:alpha/beta hydrolase [Amycolatopsis sp.]MCU1682778.1 alpha/beta hydrolase fold protein [Amycolatopsis sp.]